MRHDPTDRLEPYRATRRRLAELRQRLAATPATPSAPCAVRRTPPRLLPPGHQDSRETRSLYRTPVEEAEARDPELLAAKQRRAVKAVWRSRVGAAPDCGPGDTRAAMEYLSKLLDVSDRHSSAESLDDGTSPLTRSEAAYLRLQIAKWRRRAMGLDPRFQKFGTRPGRAPIRRTF